MTSRGGKFRRNLPAIHDYLDQAERFLEERPDVIAAKHVAAGFVFIDRGVAQLAEIAGLDVQDVDPVNPS